MELTKDQLTEKLIAVKYKCYQAYLRSLDEEYLAMEYCDHIGNECGELNYLLRSRIIDKLEDWASNALFDDPMMDPINMEYMEACKQL